MASTIQGNLLQAQKFVKFLNKSPSPFHAVDETKKALVAAGFKELKDNDDWQIQRKEKYFVTRNKSAILAFVVGNKWQPGNGFSVVAAHTDSPCLRVKPVSKLSRQGCLQVAISTYGGGLWRTWFDRDLAIAGRIFVKKGDKLVQQLVRVDKPILYLPSLCIHLEKDRENFTLNKEEHLRPIISTEKLADELNAKTADDAEHHSALLKVLAETADVRVEDIYDLDLYLYDTQDAAIGGGLGPEFVSGARLDNLVGTYTSIVGLIESLEDASIDGDSLVRMVACYDNEECGSESVQGAGSACTEWAMRRIMASLDVKPGQAEQSFANSYMISADQAHAVHPNYAEKHEASHAPKLHAGIVVKINVNQRYATTAATHAVLRRCAELADVPLQKMVVRNDSPCGSTIGPILSTRLGIRTIDVGTPQLAMHSIRELCCTSGVAQAVKLYSTFFKNCANVMGAIELE